MFLQRESGKKKKKRQQKKKSSKQLIMGLVWHSADDEEKRKIYKPCTPTQATASLYTLELGIHFATNSIKYGEQMRRKKSSGKMDTKSPAKTFDRYRKMLLFGFCFSIAYFCGHVLRLFCHFHLFASKYLYRKVEEKTLFCTDTYENV